MKHKLKVNDRVEVTFEGEKMLGDVVKINLPDDKVKVMLENGMTVARLRSKVKYIVPTENDDDDPDEFESHGFHQYNVKWDKDTINFHFMAEDAKFYGWWRRAKMAEQEACAIDIFVDYKENRYPIESLFFHEVDPRENLQSLNADICAAVNKWLYHHFGGNLATVDDILQRSLKPVVHISRLDTIDQVIMNLKECRDKAITTGGTQHFIIESNRSGDPSMRIELNLSVQARALQGRAPSLYGGSALDAVAEQTESGSSKQHKAVRAKSASINTANKDDLVRRLKASTDKKEQRKIRGILRKIGHSGGARSK